MDAHAHLRGLGWRGIGYSLDKSNRGLARPLLITHKFDSRGLGAKTQKERQDDRWWLNAFDSALKDLGTGKETALAQVQRSGFNRGGLYGFFVSGGTLASTFSDSDPDRSASPTSQTSSIGDTIPMIMESAAMTTGNSNKRKLDLEERGEQGPTEKKPKIVNGIENTASSEFGRPAKKVKYKEEKIKRQKLLREAARQRKAQNSPKVPGKPDVDAANMAPEEKERHRKAKKEARKAARQETRKPKRDMKEVAERKNERRAAKLARKQEKRQSRKRVQEGITKMKDEEKAAEDSKLSANNTEGLTAMSQRIEVEDQFANGAEEIKLSSNTDGKVRKVPGIGRVDKYPTKAEKRQRKLEARASQIEISVAESRSGFTINETIEKAEKGKAAIVNVDDIVNVNDCTFANITSSAINNDDLLSGIDIPPTSKNLKKYARKAEARGMSVEEYIRKRERKKLKKNGEKSDINLSAEPVESKITKHSTSLQSGIDSTLSKGQATPQENNVTSIYQQQQEDTPTSGFSQDSTADETLLHSVIVIDTEGDPDILNRQVRKLIWHPDMLGGRKVKELSKEERKARLEWMRERRRERKMAPGQNPMSKAKHSKLRAKRKMQQRISIVAEIMSSEDKPQGQRTKDVLREARKRANRQMRTLKKEKRNKMIHRKKISENMTGDFGG